KNDKETQEAAFRLLCLNHTMLSYISALGAHREKLTNTATLNLLDDAICYVEGALEQEQPDSTKMTQVLAGLLTRLQSCNPEPESKDQLVLQQIGLLLELLPELSELNKRIGQAG
ncbi:TIGR01666 family membrane protein, partial [Yersinia enterocolitica]